MRSGEYEMRAACCSSSHRWAREGEARAPIGNEQLSNANVVAFVPLLLLNHSSERNYGRETTLAAATGELYSNGSGHEMA